MFTVGDKVRVLDTNGAPVRVGDEGEIVDDMDENGNYRVRFSHKADLVAGGDWWYFQEHHIELVTDRKEDPKEDHMRQKLRRAYSLLDKESLIRLLLEEG